MHKCSSKRKIETCIVKNGIENQATKQRPNKTKEHVTDNIGEDLAN